MTQTFQRTRWSDGKVCVWLGRRKRTGRGEGWSGLRFDSIDSVEPGNRAAPPRFADAVLTDNPIGYWRFNEAPGTMTATDLSGNGNHGMYSTTGITLGQPGLGAGDTAALFDGLGSGRVVIPNTAVLNPRHITMESLVRWFGPNGHQQRILEKSINPAGADPLYSLSILDEGRVQVELNVDNFVTSTATIARNVATHIAATADGTMIRIYINGVLDTEAQVSPLVDSHNDLAIGNQVERNRPFNGIIDEVALYNTALSPARIQAHATAGSASI